jgi:hypothetical protein
MFRTIIAVVAVAVASLLVGGQAFGALTVYISSGGSAGEYTLLSGVMTARGYTVINGVAPTALSGTTNFGAANVVLLNMGGSLPPTIPSDGQTNLVNFVKGGKGLVTGEWLIWNPPSTLSAILPATQSGWITTAARTYTRSTADALMNDVLGTKAVLFNGDNHSGFGTYLTPKTGATTFYTASGGVRKYLRRHHQRGDQRRLQPVARQRRQLGIRRPGHPGPGPGAGFAHSDARGRGDHADPGPSLPRQEDARLSVRRNRRQPCVREKSVPASRP